ncbi:MAG: hypothetical protein WA741_03405 [Candidatus Sulfotelmatobacter sp.]
MALCFVAAELCFAADANLGTWKLHAAKSEFSSGSPKNDTGIYEAVGDKVKVTVDGTDKDGKPTHSEWTGKFDGKDYPVIGDPNSDERSYTRIGDRTLGFNFKKGGTLLLKNPYEKQSLIILLQSVLAYTFHDPFPNFRQGFCGVLRQQLLQLATIAAPHYFYVLEEGLCDSPPRFLNIRQRKESLSVQN